MNSGELNKQNGFSIYDLEAFTKPSPSEIMQTVLKQSKYYYKGQ